MKSLRWLFAALLLIGSLLLSSSAQPPQDKEQGKKGEVKGQPFPGGEPPPFEKGPPGGMMGQKRELIPQFDKDGDGKLNKEERTAARAFLKTSGNRRGPGMGPPGMFGGRGNQEPPKPGPKVKPEDAKSFPDAKLYDPSVLRTVFIEFADDDWENELADFYHTDVEVPAKLIVDGKSYPEVGVHFRGASSYFTVRAGWKRSLGVTMDSFDAKQRLYGRKSLNLLNSHEDPSMLSTVLYSHISSAHIPTPKANYAKVVINGESWGVYVNVEQFNREFLKENYKSTKGARWKVKGSPGGGGGLDYIGDNISAYKRRYEIKSADDEKSWKALVNLCKVINKTPVEELEAALMPILDVDGLLWFLAVDNAVINCDGYWIRASDYNIFRDEKGVFHIIPHDMNECFRPPMGPGMGGPGGFMGGMFGGKGGGPPRGDKSGFPPPGNKDGDGPPRRDDKSGEEKRRPPDGQPKGGDGKAGGTRRPNVSLDPLVGMTDARKPLRSKILAVPKFREQYLRNVRTIAEQSFDWKNLGPVVAQIRELIDHEVEADTRKLESYADFKLAISDAPAVPAASGGNRRMMGMPIRTFADERRKYLLEYPAIRELSQ